MKNGHHGPIDSTGIPVGRSRVAAKAGHVSRPSSVNVWFVFISPDATTNFERFELNLAVHCTSSSTRRQVRQDTPTRIIPHADPVDCQFVRHRGNAKRGTTRRSRSRLVSVRHGVATAANIEPAQRTSMTKDGKRPSRTSLDGRRAAHVTFAASSTEDFGIDDQEPRRDGNRSEMKLATTVCA